MKIVSQRASTLGAWVLGASCLVCGIAVAQDDVIARVGDVSVTRADLAGLSKSLSPENRVRLASDTTARDQLVRSMLAQKVMLAEAKSSGWEKQPQVQEAIERARREIVLQSYLASVSEPAADYPSESEVQSAYERNRAALTVPRALRLAQIFVALPANADAAAIDTARKKAADLAHRAQARGADFETLARTNSQDKVSAERGGDLGFVPETMIQPPVLAVARELKRGEVSAPVRTPSGFHVLKLVDIREATVRPLDEVRSQIRAALREQRAKQNAQAYLAQRATPEATSIDESALKQALAASQ